MRSVTTVLLACVTGFTLFPCSVGAMQPDVVNRDAASGGRMLEFRIPAKELSQALRDYQQLTQQSVLYETALVQHKTSTEVNGVMTPRQALALLLQDAGLTAQVVNERSIMLKPATVRLRPTETERQLMARRYDLQTQARLRQVLCANPSIALDKQRVVLRYWLDEADHIARVKVRIAQAPQLEATVAAALKGVSLGQRPEGTPDSAVILIDGKVSFHSTCVS